MGVMLESVISTSGCIPDVLIFLLTAINKCPPPAYSFLRKQDALVVYQVLTVKIEP